MHLESKTGRTEKRDNRETRRQGERRRLGKERGSELGNEREKETESEQEGVGGDVDDEVDGGETETKNTARRAEWQRCEEGCHLQVRSTGAGTGSMLAPADGLPVLTALTVNEELLV